MAKNISINLDLDTGNFTARMRGATGELEKFRGNLGRTDKSLKNTERHTRQWGRGLRDLVITVGLARHALLNLNDVILGLPRSIIKANAELERMKMLMVGLGGSTDGWQKANEDAEKSVESIYAMAKRAPFEVQALTDSYVKLKAAGIDPSAGAMQGLVDSVAKFGGTSEQLKRASIAIQQMAGKGVISMEELRQQLGEAVPNAVMLMARATNMSMGELVKKISTGSVEAQSALKAMFRQMQLENGGSALLMTDTWDGMTQRMKTSWIELQKIVGEAGFFDEAKQAMSELVDEFMQSADAQRLAHDLGETLGAMVKNLVEVVKFVYEYSDAIKGLLVALAAWKAVNMVGGLKGLVTGVGVATGAINTMNLALKRNAAQMLVSQGQFNMMATTMISRSAMIAAAGRMIGKGFLAALGPIGLFVAAAWTIWEVWDALVGKGEDLNEELQKMNAEFMNTEQIRAAGAQVDVLVEKVQRLGEENAKLRRYNEFNPDSARNADRELTIRNNEREIARTTAEIVNLQLKMNKAMEHESSRAANKALRDKELEIQKTLKLDRVLYEERLKEVSEYYRAQDGLSKEQQKEAITLAKEALDGQLIDSQRSAFVSLREEIVETMLAAKAAGNEELQLVSAEMVERVDRIIKSTEQLKDFELGSIMVGGDESAGKASALETYMNGISESIAEVRAQLEGAGTKLAEFEARVANGAFKGESAEAIEQARKQAAALDMQTEALNDLKGATQEYERNLRRINKLDGIIGKIEERTSTTNPWLEKAAETKQYTVELDAMVKSLKEGKMTLDEVAEFANVAGFEGMADAMDAIAKLRERSVAAGKQLVVDGWAQETIEMNENLLTSTQRVTAEYDRMRAEAQEAFDKIKDGLSPEAIAQFDAYIDALTRTQARMEETPMEAMFRDWEDSTIRFQQTWADAMEGFSSNLASALVRGEADFASFAESIVEMIVKIQLQKMIAGLVGNFMPGFGPAAGTAGSAFGSGGAFDGTFAKGGIMTSAGSLPLEKYARGGVATRPQVALFGEGDMAEAYVPLPDGRSIPAVIKDKRKGDGGGAPTVNVINQGQPAEVSSTNQRFDGESWVIDVVMKAAQKPGPLRETIKGGR